MDKLFALFAFLASLAGCNGGRDTVVHRVAVSGTDVLLSRASVQDGVARFECMRSASGTCHYLVLPQGCTERDCTPRGRRYDVGAGSARQVAGLHAFRLCVGSATPDAAACGNADTLGE